jgi:hypothetical protein
MRREWFTLEGLHAERLPDLPGTKKSLKKHLEKTVDYGVRKNQNTGIVEYSYRFLPLLARVTLVERYLELTFLAPQKPDPCWDRFNLAPLNVKNRAAQRLRVVLFFIALDGQAQAAEIVSDRFDVSISSIYRWLNFCRGIKRENYLPALAPAFGNHDPLRAAWKIASSERRTSFLQKIGAKNEKSK